MEGKGGGFRKISGLNLVIPKPAKRPPTPLIFFDPKSTQSKSSHLTTPVGSY
jgi:hypothetical protein